MKQLQHNRVLALVLCAVLVLSQTGPAALAADDGVAAGKSQETCTCDVRCTEGSVTAKCPVCGTGGAGPSLCTGGQSNDTPESEPTDSVDSVTYLDEKGEKLTCSNATLVTVSDTEWKGETGWYVVSDTVTVAQRITVTGEVHLILADSMDLNAQQGIDVSEGNSLTIYAQSTGETAGTLTAEGSRNGAGIGGGQGGDSGTITINGGNVTAKGEHGVGIGAGYQGNVGPITIRGGTVTASGGNGGIGSWTDGGASTLTSAFATAGEGGTPGNAFLITNSIQDQSRKDSWSGVVIEDNTGAVYGGYVTLITDATLPPSARLDIPGGTTLAVADGAKLTVEGAILIKDGGALATGNNIINKGSITNEPPPWVPNYGSGRDDVPTPTVPPVDPTQPELPTNAQTKVDSTVNEDGTATVEIPDQTITDAIDTAKDQGGQGGISITIQAAGTETANSVEATLSAHALSALTEAGVSALTIECAPLTVTLDLGTLKTLMAAGGALTLAATRQENAQLSAEAQAAVGHRPVYQLTATAGGTVLTQFGGQVSVAIPYTPAANEVPDSLCAVYVHDGGQVEWLEHSGYDRDAGTVQFTTDHFSAFGIGYRAAVTFADVEGHWAKEEIAFVVAGGLLNGTSDTTFHPDLSMTRGMFVTALGRLAQADVSAYQQSSFSDVAPGSYFLGYIQWASDNGIVNGIGDGAFAPDRPITREQLAVMMSHYAEARALPVPAVHGESAFADGSSISVYAVDAVRQMQMAGILAGKGGNVFDPQGTATRAEAAAALQRFVVLTRSDGA